MDKFVPHAYHQLIPFVMVLVSAGIALAFPSWQFAVAMIAVSVIAIVTSVWIAIAGKIKAEEDYWFWIGSAVEKLSRAEPEIWQALGFISPPKHATIETRERQKVQEDQEEENPFFTTKYSDVPMSPAILQVFADGILSGRKTLSEGSWNGVIAGPKYRRFQDWMESKQLVVKVNPEAPTQGYILTEAGERWLLQYATIATTGMGGHSYVRKIPVRSETEIT